MKRIKIGDVFRIKTDNGIAYFQYVFNNKTIGELIRILPGLYEEQLNNLSDLVEEKELFFIHFPLKAAYKQEIVNFVDNFDLPKSLKLPRYMRSKKVDNESKLISWQIIDYNTWKRESVNKLSPEQIKLSPWGTWNDTLLIERLSEGWTLDKWL